MSKSAGIAGLFQAFAIEKRLEMAVRWHVKIQNNYLKDYISRAVETNCKAQPGNKIAATIAKFDKDF